MRGIFSYKFLVKKRILYLKIRMLIKRFIFDFRFVNFYIKFCNILLNFPETFYPLNIHIPFYSNIYCMNNKKLKELIFLCFSPQHD